MESPSEMIEDHKSRGFLFPPVIQRMELDERHMSPFMKQRYLEENKKPKGQTVVQVIHVLLFISFIQIFRRIMVKNAS